MAQKSFLSDQTYSTWYEYDILKVWFNKIDHNMSIEGVKVNIFSLVRFSLVSYSGSEL